MALQDRDYYREDDERDWSFLPGRVTLVAIGIILAVFIVQLANKPPTGADPLLVKLGFQIDLVKAGEVWRPLTAPFVHHPGMIWPITWGLLALWLCGRWLEDEIGGRELLAYLGVVLLVTQAAEFLVRLTGLMPPQYGSYGARGIVSSLVALCAFRHPRSTVHVLVFPVPMWVVGSLWILIGALDLEGPRLKFDAALILSGAAFAGVYHSLNLRFTGSRTGFRPKLRLVPRDDDAERYERADRSPDRDDDDPTPVLTRRKEPGLDEHLEAKVDYVLEKVARSGRDSLTAEEKAVLLKAGEIYRKRRGN
jgi:membrane associated rhomboid family serine protease